ncbi:MAG: arylsulfatase [Gemmataceae bacterium]
MATRLQGLTLLCRDVNQNMLPDWLGRRAMGTLWQALLVSVCLVGWLIFPPETLAASKAARPNVLLILCDDLGFSDLGCYGGEIATPHLDALARNGLRYTQFYNTARCWPTRAAILSGYYAQQVRRDAVPGIPSGGRGVRPRWAVLLPAMLKPLGYRSYHSGKWHIDGKQLVAGFDRSYSLEDHDRHFAPKRHTEDDRALPPVDAHDGYYSSTAIASHALRCLTEHATNHRDQPFFSFVAFTAPHFPLHAPPEDVARYKKRYLAGWDALRDQRAQRLRELGIATQVAAIEREVGPPYAFPEAMKKLGPHEVNRPVEWKSLTPAQREFQASKMAVHAAMVDRMDREIGRIVALLKSQGKLDDTLILFLSDNGATAEIMVRGDGHDLAAASGSGATFLCLGPGWSSLCNTPFRRHKTWVHEGGICTPCIAHWPSGFASRGELRRSPSHVIDVVPTILEACGGKPPAKVQGEPVPPAPGRSLMPTFARDVIVARESIWWLHEGNRALRVGDWKIVAAGKDGPWELYDLRTDRTESKNLADQHPDRVRSMAAQWSRESEAMFQLARKDAPPQEKAPPRKAKP